MKYNNVINRDSHLYYVSNYITNSYINSQYISKYKRYTLISSKSFNFGIFLCIFYYK